MINRRSGKWGNWGICE